MQRHQSPLSFDETTILRTARRLRAEYFRKSLRSAADRLSRGLRALASWVRREIVDHRSMNHKTNVAALDDRLLEDIGLCRNANRLLDHRVLLANDRFRRERPKQAA